MDINYSIKLFKELESNNAVLLRKAEQAEAISRLLRKLGEEAADIVTNIDCELAVAQAQNIIDQ